MKYTVEFNEHIVRRMMLPDAQSVAQIHRDTGISLASLCKWRDQSRLVGSSVPADPLNPESWDGEAKLAVIVESIALNEQTMSTYCREKALYPE